jgi:hypothetical protein
MARLERLDALRKILRRERVLVVVQPAHAHAQHGLQASAAASYWAELLAHLARLWSCTSSSRPRCSVDPICARKPS